MTIKTPAEIQIEFLKKLKAEQKSGKGGRLPKVNLSAATPTKLDWQLSPFPNRGKRRKTQGYSLSVSKPAWLQLQEGLKKSRLSLKERRRLGDWAVELILAFPSVESMNQEMKVELFQRIREWSTSRGLK